MNNQPLVSVPVITYNSAEFVLETLESIKAQTYQNIELIISDDCSTDNTVELCRKWVEQNKNRFIRTQIIKSAINTGVSANLNRAEADCQGEWVKGIAGDDLLMPDCITNCVDYVQQHTDIIYLFGRIELFKTIEERCEYFNEEMFDYSFFDMDIGEQLDRLVFGENCVPASTCFYNRQKAIDLGIKNDERIPLLEDWPKWINILTKGVKLYKVNKILVRYRIHNGSLSTNSRGSIKMMESMQLFNLYYRYPIWLQRDSNAAVAKMVKEYTTIYIDLLNKEKECKRIKSSRSYRLGNILLQPFRWLKK